MTRALETRAASAPTSCCSPRPSRRPAAARAHRAVSRRGHHRHRRRQHQIRRGRGGARGAGRPRRAVRAGSSDCRARIERRRMPRCPISMWTATSCCVRCREPARSGGARRRDVARDRRRACTEMTPEQHDRVLASVSHLPHVLSFALVEQILEVARRRAQVFLRRWRIPRFHADRGVEPGNVARRVRGEPHGAAGRTRRVHGRARAFSRRHRHLRRRRARSRVRALARGADRMAEQRGAAEARRRHRCNNRNWTQSWNTSISDLFRVRPARFGCPARRAFRTACCCSRRWPKAKPRSPTCSIPTTRA